MLMLNAISYFLWLQSKGNIGIIPNLVNKIN